MEYILSAFLILAHLLVLNNDKGVSEQLDTLKTKVELKENNKGTESLELSNIKVFNNSGILTYRVKNFTSSLFALKEFPQNSGVYLDKRIVKEIEIFHRFLIRKENIMYGENFNYLQIRHPSEYYELIVKLAKKFAPTGLEQLDKKQAMIVFLKVARFQLSGLGEYDEKIIADIKTREGYESFAKNINKNNPWSFMSIDEYFLGGRHISRYYCGMVSWNAYFIFNYLKQNIPALENIHLFEWSTGWHSMNLIAEEVLGKINLYGIDILPEQFLLNYPDLLDEASDEYWEAANVASFIAEK